jgi:LAO/AO transport system kinase
VKTIATSGEGIPELSEKIAAHRAYLQASGTLIRREQARVDLEIAERLREQLLGRLLASTDPALLADVMARVTARSLDPASAVKLLVEKNHQK